MKAFLLISTMGAGGAERAMSELAGFLCGRDWSVTLATFEDASARDFYPLHPAVRRLRLGNPAPEASLIGKLNANRQRLHALRAAIEQERPQVVLSFMETSNVLALLAGHGARVPVVVAERTDPSQHLAAVPGMWRLARRLLYRRAFAVVTQTRPAAEWLGTHCHCPVEVIPNALRELPLPAAEREAVVACAGRFDAAKGIDLVLRAFACAASDTSDTSGWRLAVAGDGPLREVLHRLAMELGVQDRVDWLGRRNDLEQLFGRAAIVAQGSRYEGFPNVLMEAMGMGAAVVSTDCRSGPRELIEPGANGFLVPVDDVTAMADRLRQLMNDEPLRQRLGAAAIKVRTKFSQAPVLGRWESLMLKACGKEHS